MRAVRRGIDIARGGLAVPSDLCCESAFRCKAEVRLTDRKDSFGPTADLAIMHNHEMTGNPHLAQPALQAGLGARSRGYWLGHRRGHVCLKRPVGAHPERQARAEQ
jgi:hypothetical protein